ncbi:hypothetical protein KUV89_18490 [Marinobacter hydrocarbonoclasticus]|nr:hypothetical protein [Marinobacter nauticus]
MLNYIAMPRGTLSTIVFAQLLFTFFTSGTAEAATVNEEIDLAFPPIGEHRKSKSGDKINFTITNIPPGIKYSTKIELTKIEVTLKWPEKVPPLSMTEVEVGEAAREAQEAQSDSDNLLSPQTINENQRKLAEELKRQCDELNSAVVAFSKETEPMKVQSHIDLTKTRIEQVLSSIREGAGVFIPIQISGSGERNTQDFNMPSPQKYSVYTDNATWIKKCVENIANARLLEANTTYAFSRTMPESSNMTVTIEQKSKESDGTVKTETAASITFKGDSREFYSHLGVGFLDDRNRNYFSADTGETDADGKPIYQVQEGASPSGFNYSIMAVFSYPVWDIKDNKEHQFALSAGLGASLDTPIAYFGISYILNEAFLISGGAAIAEREVLKPNYSTTPGDSNNIIGTKPIDSKDLVETTYKPTYMLVFGYRF